jgi:tight adherence protein B
VELVTREAQPPISEEFERVVREMSLGVALQPRCEPSAPREVRGPRADGDRINIQSQVGGNLATVLDSIAFTIRERIRIIGEITGAHLDAALQRLCDHPAPRGPGRILFLISPTYITSLFRNPPVTLGCRRV